MRKIGLAWAFALVVVLSAAAKERAVRGIAGPVPPHDIFSAAQPAQVRIIHLSLHLTVDFDARQVRGSVTHTIANLAGTRKLTLDTRDLDISEVTIDGRSTTWTLGTKTEAGRTLTIDIEPGTRVVRIDYQTKSGQDRSPLQFLTARQTATGVAPFLTMFTEPDYARGWIPLQDTPGVKMSWDATIRVPPGLLAVMSGRNNPQVPSIDGVYHFSMPRPVPAYLIALAVGHLEFRALDERTGFYAESPFVEEAAFEMQYIPDMLDTAERILGPYPWGRYDILIAPASSAGGMEYPMLNFISLRNLWNGNHETPPIPSSVVAHELSHAWVGDLVTCGTWSDIWLNEGAATYYEHRILEEMIGPERAELGFYFDRSGFEDWANSLTPTTLSVTRLHIEFAPGDTLSIFSPATYNKGSMFLKMLEDELGRPAFDIFMRSYLYRRAYGWADDQAFVGLLREELLDENPDLESRIRLDEWIHGTGLPSNVTAPRHSAIWDRVGIEAGAFRAGAPASSLNTTGWTSLENVLFLWQISDIIKTRMPELDATFGFSAMNTPPTAWLTATGATLYAPGIPAMERFLAIGGFDVVAVYVAMYDGGTESRKRALELYASLRDHYDPNTQAYLDFYFKPTHQKAA